MTTRLLAKDVWKRIKSLSSQRGAKSVAVPYLGTGARRQLPLRNGDLLVVRFDEPTVKAGAIDPREIAHYLRKGVSVHSLRNLHAKVFVLGRTAIIGSTNVSQNSERGLIEAAVETTDKRVVGAARKFVDDLRGDIIEPEYVKQMLKLYKPPRRSPPPPPQSPLWAVPLTTRRGWEDEDNKQQKPAKAAARKRLLNPRQYDIQYFCWDSDDKFLAELKLGDRAMQCTDAVVSPPGRVIVVHRYRVKGKRRALVCLAVRKNIGRRQFDSFVAKLGPVAKPLRKMRSSALYIRNPDLVSKIGRIWPKARE